MKPQVWRLLWKWSYEIESHLHILQALLEVAVPRCEELLGNTQRGGKHQKILIFNKTHVVFSRQGWYSCNFWPVSRLTPTPMGCWFLGLDLVVIQLREHQRTILCQDQVLISLLSSLLNPCFEWYFGGCIGISWGTVDLIFGVFSNTSTPTPTFDPNLV